MLSLLSRIVDPLVYILIGNNLLLVCTVRCLYYGIFSCELIDNPKLNGRNLSAQPERSSKKYYNCKISLRNGENVTAFAKLANFVYYTYPP